MLIRTKGLKIPSKSSNEYILFSSISLIPSWELLTIPREVEEEKPKPARQTRFAHPTTLHKAKAGEASHTRLPQRPWFSAGTTEEVDGNELQDESKDLAASKKDLREEIVRADIERYECNIRGGMVMAAAPARFVSFSGHREFR